MIDAILKLLPAILSIIEGIVLAINRRGLIDQGRMEEIAAASQRLNSVLAQAASARQEAAERHAKDDTDAAFDPDFKRKD